MHEMKTWVYLFKVKILYFSLIFCSQTKGVKDAVNSNSILTLPWNRELSVLRALEKSYLDQNYVTSLRYSVYMWASGYDH